MAESPPATAAAPSEYEREPVPEHALKGPRSFWGMYAGEHTAGTEFMLGPLFIAWGASALDVILGLLLGNILAVLTWRYVTAPIATDTRMTLYFKLEKICGRKLVALLVVKPALCVIFNVDAFSSINFLGRI